jgi:uncharacterized protein involved in type VI secretion and phage assembly
MKETLAGPVIHQRADAMNASYLAKVVKVKDSDKPNQVQVRLLNYDGVAQQDGPIWARVALPFAGKNRGLFMLPDEGDEVLVQFVNGDSRFPVVVGGLWNGKSPAPAALGGDKVDRWLIVSKAGSKISIVEPDGGQPTISIETPGGVKGTFTDESGGKIELTLANATSKITMDSSGVSVNTNGQFQVQANSVSITSGTVDVSASISSFTNMLQCDTHQATTVIAATYTPGAGNVW